MFTKWHTLKVNTVSDVIIYSKNRGVLKGSITSLYKNINTYNRMCINSVMHDHIASVTSFWYKNTSKMSFLCIKNFLGNYFDSVKQKIYINFWHWHLPNICFRFIWWYLNLAYLEFQWFQLNYALFLFDWIWLISKNIILDQLPYHGYLIICFWYEKFKMYIRTFEKTEKV